MSNYFYGKTILVTGASGFIGSNLVFELLKYDNVRLIVNGRSLIKLKEVFGNVAGEKIEYYVGDVCDKVNLKDKIDIIFHAASPQENKVINERPLDIIFPNVIGTINCFEFVLAQKAKYGHNVKVILFSSVTVYKNLTETVISVCEDDTFITDSLQSSSACYSQSKRMSEVIAAGYKKQYFIDLIVARLSTVYGYSLIRTETAFFQFIEAAEDNLDIYVKNPNSPRRDNIYIDDAISALIILAEKGVSGEAYNVSTNKFGQNFASIYDIAKKIVEIKNEIDPNNTISLLTDKESIDSNSGLLLDNSKLLSLDWVPKVSLSDGLRMTLLNSKNRNK